ncbi:MAG: epoxyqueuosine reductase QueH [Eubacterium sp.]|nr:epoxyqueuosine reductase QueH [Eubacterium sp.]
MNNINYQKVLDRTIEEISKQERTPTLLLHSCCAPCSSYVIEYLSDYFEITVFYYNPNLYPDEEYTKRAREQQRLIASMPTRHPVHFVLGDFDKDAFHEAIHGYEQIPEGGERCFRCYRLRLENTAALAQQMRMDYFTTTLSISPLKNAQKLNEIGKELADIYQVPYLCSDFKKKNGYKRSVELSKEYDMYRQDYCGCVYSKKEREAAQLAHTSA